MTHNHHLGISIDQLIALAEEDSGLVIPRGLTRQEVRAYVRANSTYRKG